MNIINDNEIVEGMHLDMQREPDAGFSWFYWGVVGNDDIPRLKREIRSGTFLWRKSILIDKVMVVEVA